MWKIGRKNNSFEKGFSLVEMLVAVGIFMSIMTIAITALVSIIGANKKAQAIKGTIDSVTFAVEDISRGMVLGTNYKCSLDKGGTFQGDCPGGGNAVSYLSGDGSGDTVTYIFNGVSSDPNASGIIIKKTSNPATGETRVDLISQDSGINISNMKFYVLGVDNEGAVQQSDRTQPRVILTISGIVSVKGSNDTEFDLQTSFSQRFRK